MERNTIIIAEAGVNHNGNIKIALEMIQRAKTAGANYIKFQTYKTENLVTLDAPLANYQKKSNFGIGKNQYDMLKSLEMNHDMHKKIYQECKKQKIKFLSTPFDIDSLEYLNKNYKMDYIKIASGEITNFPLLLKIAQRNENILLSTGMCDIKDIENALSVIGFGYYFGKDKKPFKNNFKKYFRINEVQDLLKEKVTLLHCTSEYPASTNQVNLKAISKIKNYFNINCGYSDHTIDIDIPVWAVCLGANVIEKHVTLDTSFSGPDHKASINFEQFRKMVNKIRLMELALGHGNKEPTESELENIHLARKGIKAKNNITKGEVFSESNIITKRPYNITCASDFWEIIGKKAKKNYSKNEDIEI